MAKRKGRSVGVIGLGSMGLGVARTLVKKGFQVHALRRAAAGGQGIRQGRRHRRGEPGRGRRQCLGA